jgi:hypothetical protein
MRGCLSGLAGVVIFALPVVAQSADPFEAKVQALTHPKYAEREKAARDLMAAGEPALTALKAVQASTDEELRSRAAAIAEKIERVARSKRLLVAPTLNVKFDKVPLDMAVAELGQKTGLRFLVDGTKIKDVKHPITFETGELPFWEAVQAFYRAAGLTEDDSPLPPTTDSRIRSNLGRVDVRSSYIAGGQSATPAIRLIDGSQDAPSAASQAFRVRALPAGFAANKRDDAKGELTIHLDIDALPTMTVVEILGVEVRKAIADDRRVLASAYPAQTPHGDYFGNDVQMLVAQQLVIMTDDLMSADPNGSSGTHYAVTLKTGGSRPKHLSELHGIVVARIIAPPEPVLTVADIFGKGRGQVFRTEGLTCEVLAERPQAEKPPPPPRIVSGPPPPRTPEPPLAVGATESFVVRVVSTADQMNDILNVPIQMKGRMQQFIRINRGRGARSFPSPSFQVRTEKGMPVRVVGTQIIDSTFNGSTMSQDVRITIDRPLGGADGISLTLTSRRPATVEMPFVLRNVQLP